MTYALSITQALNWGVRMISEMETNVVSVERIDLEKRLVATLAPLGSVEDVESYLGVLSDCATREDRYLALYALACTKNNAKPRSSLS